MTALSSDGDYSVIEWSKVLRIANPGIHCNARAINRSFSTTVFQGIYFPILNFNLNISRKMGKRKSRFYYALVFPFTVILDMPHSLISTNKQ